MPAVEGERTAYIIEISYSPTHTSDIQQKILLQTNLSGKEPLGVSLSASVVEKQVRSKKLKDCEPFR
ncbi:hypothetical protein K2X85_14290 [bacterium]|nr:hypothetical protein [bacterium]